MAQALRWLDGSGNALQAQCLADWRRIAAEAAASKKRKEQTMAQALRWFDGSGKALQAQCLAEWRSIATQAAAGKKRKDRSMAQALRWLDGSGKALQAQCLDAWHRASSVGKLKHDSEAAGRRRRLEEATATIQRLEAEKTHIEQAYARLLDRVNEATPAPLRLCVEVVPGVSVPSTVGDTCSVNRLLLTIAWSPCNPTSVADVKRQLAEHLSLDEDEGR